MRWLGIRVCTAEEEEGDKRGQSPTGILSCHILTLLSRDSAYFADSRVVALTYHTVHSEARIAK